jgi:succinate dehydrogenase/fumarate reductase cytochrome b subunit
MFLLLLICHTTDNVCTFCMFLVFALCISTLLLQDMCSMSSKYNEIDDCSLFVYSTCLRSFSYCVCMHACPGMLTFFNK